MRRSLILFGGTVLCALTLHLTGCGSQDSIDHSAKSSASDGHAASKRVDAKQERTKVTVVVTQHFITDMPEGYAPAHLRAILEKISPDVLAVEAPTNVTNPWDFAPFELWNVTQPWAKDRGIDAVPAGWYEPQYQVQLSQMFQEYQANGKTVDYQRIEERFQADSAAQSLTCRFMNSAAYHGLWRDYHNALHALLGRDTPWEHWNARILNNVSETCQEYPGQHVVAVFGGAHGYYLLDRLSNDPAVEVVSTSQFFPLTEDEIDSHTQPIDYLKALRLLNFEVVDASQLAHMETLLQKVSESPEFAGDFHLFHGKFLMHKRQFPEAFSEFERLVAFPRESISRFDGTSRLVEAGSVYSAIALNGMGDRVTARERLANVVNDTDVFEATRQWAQRILTSLSEM